MALNLQEIKTFYFVGIGGIGMSALARFFRAQGKSIYGYDRVPTDLTKSLVDEGMEIVLKIILNLFLMK